MRMPSRIFRNVGSSKLYSLASYGVPFVPKCLTFCGNLENLAPMKRAVFMISFSFLVKISISI